MTKKITKRLDHQIEDLMDRTAINMLSRFLGQSGRGSHCKAGTNEGLNRL